MDYIRNLHIEGFKKFDRLDITFNRNMNILVGENESGKSTILEALKIVFNQQYKNSDKSILHDLFNATMVNTFKNDLNFHNLPYIVIELELEIDPHRKNAEYFYGENNYLNKATYGISFRCEFNKDFENDIKLDVENKSIPYEYYSLTWRTFAGLTYYVAKRPLKFLSIDTSDSNPIASFNYYNRTLFLNLYNTSSQVKIKNDFRNKLLSSQDFDTLDNERKFAVDPKKVILENVISVYDENNVALENRGSGMENIIKTEIALSKSNGTTLDVILMEEPENHLSYSNLLKMIEEISSRQKDSQMVIATHSDMIASRLNLRNVIWITGDSHNTVMSLDHMDEKIATFFTKADNNKFLQFLLADKIVLVEGATEFLLIPHFYEQIVGHTLEQDRISIISCNGIAYTNYLSVAENTNKKIAVLTDNDRNQEKIDNVKEYNEKHKYIHIFMDNSINEWTWEVCFYHLNQVILDEMIELRKGAKYLLHGNECETLTLGKMLNNKVEIAYKMLISGKFFKVPDYVKDAIKWISA